MKKEINKIAKDVSYDIIGFTGTWRGKNREKGNTIIGMDNSGSQEYLGILIEYINGGRELFSDLVNRTVKGLVGNE